MLSREPRGALAPRNAARDSSPHLASYSDIIIVL